jgi:hypothetical protein
MLLLSSYYSNATEPFRVAHTSLPGAFARMLVQIPSQSTRHTGPKVTATLDGVKKSGKLDNEMNTKLVYLFTSLGSDVDIHVPPQGCYAYLVYDLLCTNTSNMRALTDRHVAAETMLQMCVEYWVNAGDTTDCAKLVVPLLTEPAWHGKEQFSSSDMQDERNRSLVEMMAKCKGLDVSLAGECMCVCVHIFIWFFCVYVCTFVCLYVCF